MCPDDEATGWAQFEILGQIRAKPACKLEQMCIHMNSMM